MIKHVLQTRQTDDRGCDRVEYQGEQTKLFIDKRMCGSEGADRTIDKDIVVVPQGMQHLIKQRTPPVSYTHLTLPTNREV